MSLAFPDDMSSTDLPLAGLRVVELSDGKCALTGRILADLGAEVIAVEPPGGVAARKAPPRVANASLYFATHYANKRSIVLNLEENTGQEDFLRLIESADMLIETFRPGALSRLGLDPASLLERQPDLVVLSITDFGQTGPYRDYVATNAVHAAMAGVLCCSGLPGRDPLLPPAALMWESAAVQAAWVAMLGLWQRKVAGLGDVLDFSIYEAVAQVFDPAMGATGSAAAGQSALDSASRGRPVAMPLYPVIRCKDGYVRLCVLNPRQWEAMSAWMGPDHPFTDPKFGSIVARRAHGAELNAYIARSFAQLTQAELQAEGQRRGVPLAAVATVGQALQDDHFNARGAFVPLTVAPGIVGRVPAGFLEVDGVRAGLRNPAPALGADTAAVLEGLQPRREAAAVASGIRRRPLEGIRVLDLGVIVAGAEAGRIMADQGAEVIKIENRAFPDGGRQSSTGNPISPSIAQGQRNKLSLGLNLRSEKGRDLFKELVAQSDVVLSNFKPGTLESLGIGYDVLSAVNPRIIVMDSSALGNTGPRSRSLGYGPLVRASTGLSSLWRYPDDSNSFSDGITIYPDHVAARVAIVGVMALLLRRERTGRGGQVSLSQAEIFLNSSSEYFLRESLEPGSVVPLGNSAEFTAPDGLFPCAGDDEWCVVSVRDDGDWKRLLGVVGREDLLTDPGLDTAAGRVARRAEVDAVLAAWTIHRSPREVTEALQSAGVPAGFMQRLTEYRSDPQFAARGFIRELTHSALPKPLPTENRPVFSRHMADPEIRPAPYQAEHTREVATRLLRLSDAEIDRLIAAGDLETMLPAPDGIPA